ncbi:hypothetical protein M427DRAFT_421758 [Gonapodya prolifera JEL478]|uniref:F-box domain-containing protein n=1 Tax=Gonapodya prolifera (strain JEL478) TaxID=1344416 RepID=A0A139A5J0_GONPJ|nr:hypothetical protein M427DRAFT_421758 [Gonapodya prolifera JEL478]|eukprot:KXS11735.1 hypothetical protein M427DRAFT_421758 [Gonapodya prolifera JEL478]
MPRLPHDIIHLIVLQLAFDPDPRTLCALRLVSRSCDDIAARKIHRIVRPRSLAAVQGLTKVFDAWKRARAGAGAGEGATKSETDNEAEAAGDLSRGARRWLEGPVDEVDLQLVFSFAQPTLDGILQLLRVLPPSRIQRLYVPQLDHPVLLYFVAECPALQDLAMPAHMWRGQPRLIGRLRGIYMCPDVDGGGMDISPLLECDPPDNLAVLETVSIGTPRDGLRGRYLALLEELIGRVQSLKHFRTGAAMSPEHLRLLMETAPRLEAVDLLHTATVSEEHLQVLAELGGATLHRSPVRLHTLHTMHRLTTLQFNEGAVTVLSSDAIVDSIVRLGTLHELVIDGAGGGLESYPFQTVGTPSQPGVKLASAFERVLAANKGLRKLFMFKCPAPFPVAVALDTVARLGRRLEYVYVGGVNLTQEPFEQWLRESWRALPNLRHVGRPFFLLSYLNIGVIYERDSAEASAESLNGTPFWRLKGRRDVRVGDMWGRSVFSVIPNAIAQ